MVGVPALTLCVAGPSVRMGCPMPWLRNHRNRIGVMKMLIRRATPPESPRPSTL